MDEEGDATIDADKFKKSTGKHGDEDEFAHSADATCHSGKPTAGVESARGNANGTREEVADEEHEQHILTHERKGEHGKVGDYIDALRKGDGGGGVMGCGVEAQHEVERRGDDSSGEHDADVGAKLVAHPYALRACGNDGGVGDEREVVAKECTAHGGCYDEGSGESRFSCQPCRYGGEGNDGSYGGSDAHADEA